MSSAGNAHTSYPAVPQLAAGLMDIPSSMLSDSQPRLIASQVRQVQLPSQSGNQSAGGVVNFQISTGVGQGYLKRGSCYLKTKVVITTTTNYSGAQANLPYNFAQTGVSFGGPLAQASSIINRLTLLSGGSVIEQINNYDIVANIVNGHAASAHYAGADHGIYENAFQQINAGTADVGSGTTTQTITVTIPLMSGLLQSQHHLPLFLLSGNLQLQLDLNNASRGFNCAAADVTAVDFQDNVLMYEQLSVDAVMEATLKQSLMRAPFQIPFNSFVSLAVSSASTLSQPIGLNLSSAYGVLVGEVLVSDNAQDKRKWLHKNNLSSIKLFADGRLVNSHQVNTDPLFYAEMNKVFNLCFDPVRTSCLGPQFAGPDAVGTTSAGAVGALAAYGRRYQYDNYLFASGICMTRVSEDGVVMAGSPVNQMLVELQHIAGFAPATAYFIVPHQLILTVDIAGTAAVIR